MLQEDTTSKELNEEDTTILVRVLLASVKKAVGEKIVPSTEQRKTQSLTKAQKVCRQFHRSWMLLTLRRLLY
jgi:cohesin complex subunit SA-1/2